MAVLLMVGGVTEVTAGTTPGTLDVSTALVAGVVGSLVADPKVEQPESSSKVSKIANEFFTIG